jgi:hypothetical protein
MKNIFKPMAAFSILCFFHLALAQNQPAGSFWSEDETVKASFSKLVCRETADILQNFPGIWTKQLESRGQWRPFRFRGSEFSQSVALWNGFEITDPWTGRPDLSWIPDAWIDSVKVFPVLGPRPFRPIGAVIDIESDQGSKRRPVTRIDYDKDRNGYGRTFVTFSKPFSTRLDLGFGLAVRQYGNAGALHAYDDEYVHGQMAYRITQGWKLTYRYIRDKSKLDLPFSTYVPSDTLLQTFPRFDIRQTHHFLSVSGPFLRTEVRIRRSSYAYGVIVSPDVYAHQTGFSLQQAADSTIPSLSWGVQFKWEDFSTPVLRRENGTTAHAMLGTHFSFLRNFRADIQAHTHFSTDRRIYVLGSGQVSWRPADALSSWVAMFQGVRDPSLGERTGWFFSPFPPVTPNDWAAALQPLKSSSSRSLHPERSINAEAGCEVRLNLKIKATLRTYGRETEGLIVRSTSGAFVNAVRNRFWGAESSFRLGPFWNCSADIVLNYLKSEDDTRRDLFDRSNFWGNGCVSWTGSFFSGDLIPTLAVSIQTWSEFWNVLDRPNVPSMELLPFQYLMNVKLIAAIMKKAAASFTLENCLGSRAELVVGHPLPSRLFVFGFSWELLD